MSVDAFARLEHIRAEVDSLGKVRVTELAEQFGVSDMTIRRDLDALAELGLVERIWGGATALTSAPRPRQVAESEEVIAEKLVEIVGVSGAIGLDASTTLRRLAGKLDGARALTAFTNSMDTFNALDAHEGVNALLSGGRRDPQTGSLLGPLAMQAAKEIVLRTLFISSAGIDPQLGTTEATFEEAEFKRVLANAASQVIVAIDSSKLGDLGVARGLPIDRVDVLVTELPPTDARLAPYRDCCDVL